MGFEPTSNWRYHRQWVDQDREDEAAVVAAEEPPAEGLADTEECAGRCVHSALTR